jgi:hypothetical protein
MTEEGSGKYGQVHVSLLLFDHTKVHDIESDLRYGSRSVIWTRLPILW